MMIQYAIVGLLGIGLLAFFVWLHREGRKTDAKRTLMTEAERKATERDDATWAQRYGF